MRRYVAGEDLTQWKGGKQKLSSGEALIAADCLARGLGREQTAYTVSAWREKKGVENASVSSPRLSGPLSTIWMAFRSAAAPRARVD